MQSQPVQRSLHTQPFSRGDAGGVAQSDRGVTPSGYGVQPSFGWGDVWDVVKQVAPQVIQAL
jgi:hypothetical protein